MSDGPHAADQSPDATAAALLVARDELVAFVERCDAAQWASSPHAGEGDPRATRVIVDHVADAYGYIGGWIRELVDGGAVAVDSGIVDGLNAEHAERARDIAKDVVVERLRTRGDDFASLIRSLSNDDLTKGDGRVGRLTQIGVLHTGGHLRELEASFSTPD